VEVPEQGAFEGGEVRVWDVRRRARTRLRFEVTSASLAFSPDGRLLAAATHFDRTTDIRDTRTGRLVARLPAQEVARSVAFSGDGDLVATGEYDGTVRLWSTRTWQPAGPPLEAHEARVVTLAFSPGDALLASASEDGTVALWDVATRHPVGSPLRLGDDRWVSAAFTPDGAQVVAVSNDGHGLRFPTSPAAWARHACRVAGRELSASEWADALPDHPRRAVCGG
jgi:WD40 repeat protein